MAVVYYCLSKIQPFLLMCYFGSPDQIIEKLED